MGRVPAGPVREGREVDGREVEGQAPEGRVPEGRVLVVGLGPAGPEALTAGAELAIRRVPHRFVRTRRHPSAAVVADAVSFDGLYESAATLDEVYGGIVDALVEAAARHGEVLYAVPGSPLVAERTVELLRADDRVDTQLVPAVSFLDLAWARLGIDPVATGVRLVDGQRFPVEAAGERGPLLVAQCDSRRVLSEIKLAVDDRPEEAVTDDATAGRSGPAEVVVLRHLGLDDELVATVGWAELDRSFEPDHLTSLYIPVMAAPVAAELMRFAELVRTLRERCPWDREQTHRSLTRHLLEETYEVLEAIEALDPERPESVVHLEEELGDLLFQVVFHATLAAEEGAFTLADVARGVHDKLVLRHPHVFAGVEASTPGQVVRNWEQIKKAEKGHASLMDGISGDLPSLLYAHKVQRKAASVGLRWEEPEGALAPALVGPDRARRDRADGPGIDQARREAVDDAAMGRVLFAAVDLARRAGVDPEAALRGLTAAFRRRFVAMERLAAERGQDLADLAPADLDRLWSEVTDVP